MRENNSRMFTDFEDLEYWISPQRLKQTADVARCSCVLSLYFSNSDRLGMPQFRDLLNPDIAKLIVIGAIMQNSKARERIIRTIALRASCETFSFSDRSRTRIPPARDQHDVYSNMTLSSPLLCLGYRISQSNTEERRKKNEGFRPRDVADHVARAVKLTS